MSAEHATTSTGTEQALLHLILRKRWDAAALDEARALATQNDIAWDSFLQAARAGSVSPLVYEAVRGQDLLPASVEESLRLDYFGVARINVLRFHRLEEVLRRLTDKGIDVILLKGAALAEAVYGNLALRPMCDFDLLIHKEDVDAALGVLAELGYERGVDFRPDYRYTYRNQIAVYKADGEGTMIEVHWHPIKFVSYQRAVPVDWFWQTALPIRIGDSSAKMLGAEAQVLHLCYHIVQHGGCKKVSLRQLYDVAEVIVSCGAQLDWDRLLVQAQAFDLALTVQQVLGRVKEEWDVQMPDQVLDRLRALRPSAVEKQLYTLLDGGPTWRRIWARLIATPGWRARLRHLGCDLFPSVDFMQAHYHIAYRILVPLYYPYRWFRGLQAVIR